MTNSLFKKNVAANYLSQIYIAVIGILVVPFYISYIGAESYGLVGFFTMLQAFFAILDMGLTPTITREFAKLKAKTLTNLKFMQFYFFLTCMFFLIALIGGALLWSQSSLVAESWLNIKSLSLLEVTSCLEVISICVVCRWLCGLYRGVIVGGEKLIWLSAFNFLIANLKFLAVFLSMYFFGYSVLVFFYHQLVVAIIELLGLFFMSRMLLPKGVNKSQLLAVNLKEIAPTLKFSFTIAITASVWSIVTQADKFILSGLIPLDEYGYYTLAVLVASGITILSSPISNAIMPRMTYLYSTGKRDEMLDLYRKSTRFITALAGSISIIVSVFSKEVLVLWTNDINLSDEVSPILTLYILGNGLLAISAFSYYLQYAQGNLKYHLRGNLFFLFLIVPLIFIFAEMYGGYGAASVWLSINIFYLLFWSTYVHYKLESSIVFKWLFYDVLLILIPVMLLCLYIKGNFHISNDRLDIALKLFFISILVMFLSLSMSRAFVFFKNKFRIL